MNRKLFANRDARRKLANMGGIVASSPELLGTAQTFQNGGTVPSRRSDIESFEDFTSLRRSRGPNTAREAELFNNERNAQANVEYNKIIELIRFYQKTDPDYAKLLGEKYAPYINRKLDEMEALFNVQSGDVNEISNYGIETLLPRPTMDRPSGDFSVVSPQDPTQNYPTYSRQSDKGFASIYQQPNVELTSSPILNQESEISTQNDLTEFEKIRQGMDAVPEAGEKVSDSAPVLDKELGSTTLNMALDAIDKRQDEGRISPADANFEKIIASGRLSEFDDVPEAIGYGFERMMPPIPSSEKNDESNPYQADIDAAVESFTGAATENNFDGPIKKSGSTLSGSNFILTPNEGYPYPTDSPELRETKPKITDEKSGSEEITVEEKETANKNLENLNSAISNLETGANVAEAGLSAALENSGVETKDLTLKQKVQSMEDLFGGIFGETDEDTKKANLLTAAYTFFQIAAGASPNALTNIANGVALGVDKLIKDTEARKGRGDKIKMLALEQVLGDERLEKKFGYDKILAGLRASGQSGFRKPADFSEAVRQEVDRLSKLMGNIGKSDQDLYNQAVANISRLPAYKGMTMNTDDFSSNPNIPTVEEYIKQNKILNPDYSEDEIRDMYNKRFPNVGSKT